MLQVAFVIEITHLGRAVARDCGTDDDLLKLAP
ncbi:hypothetical protein J2X92_000180 [Variovorax paradoxus]|nr:hypothetical protein [Variovorax paradoxus]